MNTTRHLDAVHTARLVDDNVKLQERITELEDALAASYSAGCPGWTYMNKPEFISNNIKAYREGLEAKVAALEAELAPVRALKVGSWQWAMWKLATGSKIIDKDGDAPFTGAWSQYEPYTLHVEPEPEPSAAELAAAIERFRRGPQGLLSVKEFDEMVALASRVKRQEGGE